MPKKILNPVVFGAQAERWRQEQAEKKESASKKLAKRSAARRRRTARQRKLLSELALPAVTPVVESDQSSYVVWLYLARQSAGAINKSRGRPCSPRALHALEIVRPDTAGGDSNGNSDNHNNNSHGLVVYGRMSLCGLYTENIEDWHGMVGHIEHYKAVRLPKCKNCIKLLVTERFKKIG